MKQNLKYQTLNLCSTENSNCSVGVVLAIVGNSNFTLLLFIPTAAIVLMSKCFLLSVVAIISTNVQEPQHKYLLDLMTH